MAYSETLHLGYSIPEGREVSIPLRHTVVTRQTQETGKTTTLEALISRSGLRAITFVTKRGEGAFINARRVRPCFRECADWQFVSSILEATLKERMKFQRSWIMKVCESRQGTKKESGWAAPRTLADVLRNVEVALETARGIHEGVYTELRAYLQIVVPEIQRYSFADRVDLAPGINVMDLTGFRSEVQSLIMRSALEWIFEKEQGVITIIPEAWEFIPQQRSNPVKLAAAQLIRKGAGLKNYVWIDSQDIAGVDKELLRQMPVWLLGVQRERNEVKRTLDQMPATAAKPQTADIMKLELGQFYACFGPDVIKTYVQPSWINGEQAQAIATGRSTADEFKKKEVEIESSAEAHILTSIIARLDDALLRLDDVDARLNQVEFHFTEQGQVVSTGFTDEDVVEIASRIPDTAIVDHIRTHLSENPSAVVSVIADSNWRNELSSEEEDSGAMIRDAVKTVKGASSSPDVLAIAQEVSTRLRHDPEFIESLVNKILSRIPSNGVVKVEPKEVVLKEFQQAEVNRILERAESLTSWQRRVLKFIEARGAQTTKAELLKRLEGKTSDQMAGTYKQLYNEADQLVDLGFLRCDGQKRLYPNLEGHVKNNLAAYGISDVELSNIVGMVLLRLS